MSAGSPSAAAPAKPAGGAGDDFVTCTIAGQWFGISVLKVQDVLRAHAITRVPMAPPEILGSLNLRGRIVTVVDARRRLGLPPAEDGQQRMSIVVALGDDLVSLAVDQVGEVLSLEAQRIEAVPPTLDPVWREIADGIYRLEDQLLVILDVERFLRLGAKALAA